MKNTMRWLCYSEHTESPSNSNKRLAEHGSAEIIQIGFDLVNGASVRAGRTGREQKHEEGGESLRSKLISAQGSSASFDCQT